MDWLRDHAWESWLILGVVLGMLELISLDLILAMLAAGAVVGMLAAMIGLPGGLQVVLALGTAIAALGVIRPSVVKRLHAGPDLKTGAAALVGRQALVLEPISRTTPGRVKIGGDIWTAQAYDGEEAIEAGETVDVLQIKGATAYVIRVPRLEG